MAEAAVTVLRIKRKATEPPLSSLVIQDAGDRAKKRAKVPMAGVFRLAETVPETWRGKGQEGDALRSRISSLLSKPSPVSSSASTPAGEFPEPSSVSGPSAPPAATPTDLNANRRYRVIKPKKSTRFPPVIRDSLAPPDVLRFVDAQAETTIQPHVPQTTWLPPGALDLPKQRRDSVDSSDEYAVEGLAGGSVEPTTTAKMDDDEVDAFLPMLKEYLSLDRPSLPYAPPPTASRPQPVAQPQAHQLSFPALEDPEYVYDLYYRDTRPELQNAALNLGAGDGVGALLGMEDLDEGSGSDESEEEDEADEDSNEEDFYRNDYPEDEDSSDDEAGYAAYARRQAYEDGGWSDDDADEEDGEYGIDEE